MIEGLYEPFGSEDHVVLGHSTPFRNAGASLNEGRSPDVTVAGKCMAMERISTIANGGNGNIVAVVASAA